jgi:cbb3-type cytochrome oxidase subunit 3
VPAPTQAPTQVPIIVRQDSGLGNVVAGAMIARSASNAHANDNSSGGGYYPAPAGADSDLANKAGADAVDTAATDDESGVSVSDAVVVIFIWLCFLALAAWVLYAGRKHVKRRREASKSNYSFERN